MQAVRKGFPFAPDHGEAKSFGLLKAIKTNDVLCQLTIDAWKDHPGFCKAWASLFRF